MTSLIGTYYKTKKEAVKKVKEKEKIFKKKFIIFKIQNGYLVVSSRQLT